MIQDVNEPCSLQLVPEAISNICHNVREQVINDDKAIIDILPLHLKAPSSANTTDDEPTRPTLDFTI